MQHKEEDKGKKSKGRVRKLFETWTLNVKRYTIKLFI